MPSDPLVMPRLTMRPAVSMTMALTGWGHNCASRLYVSRQWRVKSGSKRSAMVEPARLSISMVALTTKCSSPGGARVSRNHRTTAAACAGCGSAEMSRPTELSICAVALVKMSSPRPPVAEAENASGVMQPHWASMSMPPSPDANMLGIRWSYHESVCALSGSSS